MQPTLGTYGALAHYAKARLRKMKKRKRAEDDLDLVCDLMGRHKLVSSTTMTDLDNLVLALESRKGNKGREHITPATVNRYLASLSGAIKWVARRPELGFSNIPLLVWPRQIEKPPSKPLFTPDIEQRLLDHFSHRSDLQLVLRLLMETGARIGEIVKLKASDLSDGVWVKFTDTKNGDDRDVDVSPDLWDALQRHLRVRPLPPYHVVRDAFHRARKALGIDPSYVIHCFRHTAATRLADAGVPDTNAMRLLGHRAVKTYQRYAHKSQAATKATSKVLRVNRSVINTTPENASNSKDFGGPGRTRTDTGAILSRLSPDE